MNHDLPLDRTTLGYLADLTVAVHLAYVGYVVAGLPLILAGAARGWAWTRNGWFRGTHLVMIWIVAIEAVLHITCPLTTLEQRLRGWANQTVSERTFVGRLMDRILFVDYWEPEETPPPAPAAPPPAVESPPTRETGAVSLGPLPESPPPAAFPAELPRRAEPVTQPEMDMTAGYVGFAVVISLLYLVYPPDERRRAAG